MPGRDLSRASIAQGSDRWRLAMARGRRPTRSPIVWVALALLIPLTLAVGDEHNRSSLLIGGRFETQRFATAWTASMSGADVATGSNFSCRFTSRATISGDAVKVRLSNSLGPVPLSLQRVTVAVRDPISGRLTPPRPLTFGARRTVTIAAWGDMLSDSTPLTVIAESDVVVSIYLTQINPPVTYHHGALETSGCTAFRGDAGDHTTDVTDAAFTERHPFDWWFDALVVRTAAATGTVVSLGDSITDGFCTDVDGHERWTDVLARRLGGELGVANQSSPGNRLTAPDVTDHRPGTLWPGAPAIARLQRDVLTLPGIDTVLVFEGINDIGFGENADTILSAMRSIAATGHASGLRVVGATILPRQPAADWTPDMESIRETINAEIRAGRIFDRAVDFESVVDRDGTPNPSFYCDELHLNSRGLAALGNSVPLSYLR